MRLYDYGASANCYKVRLLLAQLDREYERVAIDIFGGGALLCSVTTTRSLTSACTATSTSPTRRASRWSPIRPSEPGSVALRALRASSTISSPTRRILAPAPAGRSTTDSGNRDADRLAARGAAVRITLDEDALDPHVTRRGFEANWHRGAHASDCEVGLDADDVVVRPRHASIGDRRCSAALHARVVRLHVRMCSDHGRDLSVQPVRHRNLLARRFAVHVQHDDRCALACFFDDLVDDLERSRRWINEE